MLAVYVHAIDPYAIKLWEGGPLRWYGLSYLLGFYLAYLQFKRVARVGQSTLKPSEPADLIVCIAIGAVLGGRLGYVFFYKIQMLWTFTHTMPYWEVLAINQGGMASHGGMIGMILACWWYAKSHHHKLGHLLDLVAVAGPLGIFWGRLANFVNGELYGRPCSADLPWAVKFPQEMHIWDPSLIVEVARKMPAPPSVMNHGLGAYVTWFIEQVQKHNPQAMEIARTWVTPRHPSQIYQALLEGLSLWLILVWIWRKPRKPWLLAGLFCVFYAIFRIIAEFFRQPDAPIGLEYGLSRGQWLSLVLLVAGCGLTRWASRRKAKPMGGWRKVGTSPGQD